jgi:hypothetical protein
MPLKRILGMMMGLRELQIDQRLLLYCFLKSENVFWCACENEYVRPPFDIKEDKIVSIKSTSVFGSD